MISSPSVPPDSVAHFLRHRRLSAVASRVTLEDDAQGRVITGRLAVSAYLDALFHTAFPTAELTLHTGLDHQGQLVLAFTLAGRQEGAFWGLPATGRWIQWRLALIGSRRQGELHHLTLFYDAGALLRQLGLAL